MPTGIAIVTIGDSPSDSLTKSSESRLWFNKDTHKWNEYLNGNWVEQSVPLEITMDEELAAALANIELLPGPKGDTGEQGIPGEQGLPGADGADGTQGLPGEQGTQGLPGENGAQGEQGIQGYPGEQGTKGDKGDTGDTGQQGIQGVQGNPGADGLNGFPNITIPLIAPTAFIVWTNMPAAVTEFLGLAIQRTKVDLTTATQSRVTVRIGVTPVANAKIKVQYSTDESAWTDLCSVTMPATANKTNIGVWTAVPSGAKADVFLRLVGIDGNGSADPSFGLITLQVK